EAHPCSMKPASRIELVRLNIGEEVLNGFSAFGNGGSKPFVYEATNSSQNPGSNPSYALRKRREKIQSSFACGPRPSGVSNDFSTCLGSLEDEVIGNLIPIPCPKHVEISLVEEPFRLRHNRGVTVSPYIGE